MNGTFLLFFSKINGYIFIPLLFLCGCIGRRIFCLSLSNCSLNHSAMGFRSMARTSLVPSVGSFTPSGYSMRLRFRWVHVGSAFFGMMKRSICAVVPLSLPCAFSMCKTTKPIYPSFLFWLVKQ